MDYLSNEEKPVITIQDITIRIRDKFILPQTSWEILTGQHWAILGPNGAGKSSLVRVLIGDLPYVRGSITYHFPNRPVEIIGYVSSELQERLIAREESQDGARYFARKLDDFEKARSTILAGDPAEMLITQANAADTDMLVVGRRIFQVSGRPRLRSLSKRLAEKSTRHLTLFP